MPRARIWLAIVAATGLAACAVPSARSNAVVMTDNNAVIENCRKLGEVNGDGSVNQSLLLDRARDSAITRLKIAAAEMNGTHVLSGVANTGWKGGSTAGVVYLCTN